MESFRRTVNILRAARCGAPTQLRLLPLTLALLVLVGHLVPQAISLQQSTDDAFRQQEQQPPVEQAMDGYPYYMQSPLVGPDNNQMALREQRANIPGLAASSTGGSAGARNPSNDVPPTQSPQVAAQVTPGGLGQPGASIPTQAAAAPQRNLPANNYQYEPSLPPKPAQPQQPQPDQTPACLYDKQYFLKLDQCLERRPYPTIGLAAFKNDDLLIKKGLSDKYGCSFILTNGLFKSFQLSKYALDSDTQCLDQDQTSQLSMQFSNVSLYYLWQLRCLNYANQLLDDSTLDGKTLSNGIHSNDGSSSSAKQSGGGGSGAHSICVGSSQSFGFASLQLSNIEAQVELSIDIYKNWRVTNVTVAMMSSGPKLPDQQGQQLGGSNPDYGHDQQAYQGQQQPHSTPATSIKDFTFDTLDGDELNWRYSHLYENWTRNRLHVNFLDQFKRFVWVSLQRCLSESSEKLPIKINDLFGTYKYN